MGFFKSFDTHQSLSASKEQTAIALPSRFSPIECVVGLVNRAPCSAGNSELIFLGTPSDRSRCAIDTQQDEGWLPDEGVSLQWVWDLRPDVGVPVLRAGHDTVGVGCPIDRGHQFVMLENEFSG